MPGRMTEEGAHRRARVLELRRARLSWADIGRDLGISTTRAYQLYQSALVEIPAAHLEEHRAEELILIDDAIQHLMATAKNEKVSPRTQIEAWNSIRSWAERKAKLLGLDADVRLEVITIDQVDREIARLEAELSIRSEATEAL